MPISSRYLIFLCLAAAAAQDAPKTQFTARELFYSAASDPAPAAKPPAPVTTPKKPATATATPTPQPKKPATPPPPPVVVATSSTKTVVATPQPPPPPPAQSVSLPGGGSIIRTSARQTATAPVNGTPLGLKYTILRKVGDEMVEVPPDTVFHADDRIQVSVQTNGPGYLYVVHQGSSGTWLPIFPSPEVAEGNNHVDGWNALTVPPGSRLKFDDLAGTEKLFVVFSRTPQENLENMIYSLQGSKIKPASDQMQDKAPPKRLNSIASVDIDNTTVGQLRDTYTRDLIIEKIDDKAPGDKSSRDKKENATYVVNPTGSSESRVVADIFMVHQ